MIWKVELPLLARAEIFPKARQFCWSDSKIWTAPMMRGWNVLKNKAVLMISPEDLNCLYNHELRFLQKCPIFNEAIWTFELSPLSWSIILSNKRQFWWCVLKVWPSPIITKWNFDRTVLMSLEKFICPYYHHLAHTMKFLQKIKPSLEIDLNIWPTPRIMSWNFCKNIEVLIMSLEKLNCTYYQPQCWSFQRRIWTCHI